MRASQALIAGYVVSAGGQHRHVGGGHEVVQDIIDGDGLDLVVLKARQRDHRQSVHEVADDLERRRSSSQDHRRLQNYRVHKPAPQYLTHP